MSESRYLIEYDIPTERRYAFYKALQRLKQRTQRFFTSTASVVILDDEGLAWQVYKLAKKYGKANIWKAVKLNGG